MKTLSALGDKFAIGLSTLCALHCLALPLLLSLAPSIIALPLEAETFHILMVVLIIPISLYTLTVGCKKHKRYGVLIWGIGGLICLVLAVVLGETYIDEFGEKTMTLIGSLLIASGHWSNYRLCRDAANQDCHCDE